MKSILKLMSFAVIGGTLVLSSCVGKGKYLTSQGHVSRLQKDSTNTHNSLDQCLATVRTLEGDKSQLQGDKSRLMGLNEQTQKYLKELQDASAKNKMTIEDQAKRLRDLETLIQNQRDVMNRLRKSVADALVNFKPDELSVYVKDGNVYVSLEEKLLFKSGSAVVDPKGKEALGKLAQVLNATQDITVNIEGHTDTVPIKTATFVDNWALSTGRAASIVRILTNDYGVDPHRIQATGRGEFHPVKTNSTPEGKASNRRTEIILSPNLKDLYQLLGQGSN